MCMNLFSDPRAQAARRATTATSILDVGAWVGLFAGMLFWSNFFWLILAPQTLPELALMLAMAAGYSLVLPMLLSTLVPSTPAGMLLQQTRWRTVGFFVTIAITGFLGYHALMILWGYWAERPTVAASGQALPMAIASLIIFVFVPALAWVQTAPDRWVAEVQAAMAVRKLKLAQEANLMVAKTQYLRAISLLRRGVANLSVAEHRELAGTLVMFQRAENEAIGTVIDSLEALTGVSTGVCLIDDVELEQAYTGITTQLGRLITQPNEAAYAEDAVDDYVELPRPAATGANAPPASAVAVRGESVNGRGAHQDATPAGSPPPSAVAEASGESRRSAASRGDSRRYAAEFRAVAAALPPHAVFGAKDVAIIVKKSERTARDMIAAWLEAGWAARGEAANSYYLTSEV
jgi:hypothetical protein